MPKAATQVSMNAHTTVSAVASPNGMTRVSLVSRSQRTRTCFWPPLEVFNGPNRSIESPKKGSKPGNSLKMKVCFFSKLRLLEHAGYCSTCL